MKYAAFLLLASSVLAQGSLIVTGDVPTPLTLTLTNLAAMPRQTVRVPNPDGSMAAYEGVALIDVLKKAGVPFGGELRGNALASYVLAKASDGYQVVFTPGELDPSFGNQMILVADHRDGSALPESQGPFRLMVANDKEGARSVRMLQTLEFVRLRK
jgi:hypothetical protein